MWEYPYLFFHTYGVIVIAYIRHLLGWACLVMVTFWTHDDILLILPFSLSCFLSYGQRNIKCKLVIGFSALSWVWILIISKSACFCLKLIQAWYFFSCTWFIWFDLYASSTTFGIAAVLKMSLINIARDWSSGSSATLWQIEIYKNSIYFQCHH